MSDPCSVCGAKAGYMTYNVLDDQLIEDWGINDSIVDYINRNQGEICIACNSNLRSRRLAEHIPGFNKDINNLRPYSLLEINEAGNLHPYLSSNRYHEYVFVQHPQVVMEDLPFDNESFDIVVHSDTLEHVENPLAALMECRRVLTDNGRLVFTVPVVWDGRPTRSRKGLPESFHGGIYKVNWEFGADIVRFPLHAGFSKVTLAGEYPASPVLICEK